MHWYQKWKWQHMQWVFLKDSHREKGQYNECEKKSEDRKQKTEENVRSENKKRLCVSDLMP